MKNISLSLLLCLGVASCGVITPPPPRDASMTKVDRNISYNTEPMGNGFLLTMHYEKMQYAPDLAGLTIACRTNLTSLAHELAGKRKRAIKNVNEQRIKIQATRHVEGPNGIDYCVASVPVEWK